MNNIEEAAYEHGKRDGYIAALKLMRDLLRKEHNNGKFNDGINTALNIIRAQLLYATWRNQYN